MIVVFLVDTSASMNQLFSSGMSALECTKSGIEHLVKHLPHVKPAEKHNDKFMLVTYEEGPGCVKSSLKDPLPHLIKELKVLKADDVSNPGSSLSTVFDMLNVYRVHHGLDNPIGGRFPGNIEPSIILWFTDGGRQSSPAGILDRLNIPGITSAGADYYHEPFRWDQRLYTIFLEPNQETVDHQLSILSTVMGGTSYRVRTLRHLLQAMDCMLGISKIPPTQHSPQAVLHIYGVVVNFEDLIVDHRRPPITANHHQLVYVNPSWLAHQSRHGGYFPIPEPFWPDTDAQRLPARSSQPTMHYHTKEEKTVEIPEGFPYDKYVVAPCPMTQELLTRPPGSCWPVYIKNSYKTEGFGFPFGFLKANTNKNAVTLTVCAYNYPALFTLLVNLNSIPGRIPTPEWLRDFSEYLSHTPSYYYAHLRSALRRVGLHNVVPADQVNASAGVLKIIAKNKMQAKVELDRFMAAESSTPADLTGPKRITLCGNAFDVPRSELIAVLDDMKRTFFQDLRITSISAPLSAPLESTASTSPSRSTLEAMRMTASKLDSLVDLDDLHSLPIADMGIYQDRMQKIQQENLRDPFRDEESVKSLQRTMFGNPYKQDKKVSIDEEDEASAADQSISSNGTSSGSSWSSILGRKRKPRRRSVSPSHFPIEKIPSLARGDRSTSNKVQVVAFGPSSGRAAMPLLSIKVQLGSDKAQPAADPTEGHGRHMVMHDGEDEDEEDDDFRRAMFNSDEMELDGDDEAARLRADTPMPGGIGLDDDDEEMEELQHAQELIPPPIIPLSLDDIVAEDAATSYQQKDASKDQIEREEYNKHRQDLEEDLEHLQGGTTPEFTSLVYDPTALMELQSIPEMIPERSPSTGTGRSQTDGSAPHASSLPDKGDQENNSETTDITGGRQGDAQSLTPIPILFAPPTERDGGTATTTTPQSTLGVAASTGTSSAMSGLLSSSPGEELAALTSGRSELRDQDGGSVGLEEPHAASIQAPSVALPKGYKPSAPMARDEAGTLEAFFTTAGQSLGQEQATMQESPLVVRGRIVKQLKMGPKTYNEESIMRMLKEVQETPSWSKEQKRAALVGCLSLARGLRRAAVVAALNVTK